MQIGGHYIFKENAKAGTGGTERERTAERAGSDNGDDSQVAVLLGGQGVGHFLGAGMRLEEVIGDPGALLGGKGGDGGQHPAQGDGNVVNVIHQANGFSGKRHVDPRG